MSMLAACDICFLEAINLIEEQRYLFGINGLICLQPQLSLAISTFQ